MCRIDISVNYIIEKEKQINKNICTNNYGLFGKKASWDQYVGYSITMMVYAWNVNIHRNVGCLQIQGHILEIPHTFEFILYCQTIYWDPTY